MEKDNYLIPTYIGNISHRSKKKTKKHPTTEAVQIQDAKHHTGIILTKEYANNDAKLYDNRVVTIEELTVVGRESHLIEETKRGSTSPTVSSKYILSRYRDFVNRKFSISEENYSDTAYLSAVERNDMETAQRTATKRKSAKLFPM